MVFESLVVDLINKYLGNYVAKLDKSQLKIGLLGGNATLENLDIKENAFDEFDLPVKVVQGHIGKLTLKIPWKHLYSEPVIAELDGLYVLVMPNSAVKYDQEKERLYKQETKQKELTRIEDAKAKRNEQKKEADTKDSFGEKFAAQVVKNLQISITNIHIRYEDAVTNPQRPFAVGITLANLSFQTCDSNGECIVIKDDATREFFKSVKMDSLALYWKSQPILFNGLTRGQMKNAMKGTISSSDNKVLELNYLIQPISCSSMMHVHMKPETTNFTVPRLSLSLNMDQIGFGFTRNQYCDLATFLDSIDRVWTQNRFLKYRPNVPLRGNTKTWWLFPYNVILEEQVRRRRRMWSWQHIHFHRTRCITYTDLWQQKLLDKKLSSEEQKTLQICEEDLDLLNITLCRQQAEMKAKKIKKKISDQKTLTGGWFSGWFGKGEAESVASQVTNGGDDLQKKMKIEFTQEEKAKLYQAIGYSEQSKDPDIPKEYVSLKLKVVLHKLTFLLSDESLSEKKLMKLSIHSVSADVQQRSAADALKLGLIMTSMQVTGSMHADGVVPILISTQKVSQVDNLLWVDFETNPLDESANQKINIRAEPLEIIYDSDTINRLVKFVTPPEELRLYELSTQVAASLEDVKEMTATGLRHIADQRMYTDIKVNVKPSYFILPEGGAFKKDCRMLLVDLGSITVCSQRTSTINSGDMALMGKDGKLDYDTIKESAYDKFRITMSTIQVLLIEHGDDWRKLRSQELTKSHILRPFGFDFQLKKCVISNDVNLANIFIEGCLPSLGLNVSDKALQSLLDLILHVPFPQTEPPKVLPVKEEILKGMDTSPFRIAGLELSGNQVLRAAEYLPDSETASTMSTVDDEDEDKFFEANDTWDGAKGATRKAANLKRNANVIDLDMVFVITMFELQIFEETVLHVSESVDRKEIMKLVVDEIGITFTLKRYDMNVQAYVGGLKLAVPQFLVPNTKLPICLAQTKKQDMHQNLLYVKLMIAEKTCPDFVTFYHNTRHTLECNFKALDICLHQEALLLLLNFANSLMVTINVEEKNTKPNWSATIGDKEGVLEDKEKYLIHQADQKKIFPVTSVMTVVSDQIESNKEKRIIRLDAVNEAERAGKSIHIPETLIIQWAVTATLEKLRISFSSEKYCDIFDVSVHGMRADVKMTYRTTEVSLSVTDLRVQDPTPTALYRKLIWIEPDESIFSTQIVIFNQGTTTPGYEFDLSKVDTTVHLEIGKVKIIFLYSFINRMQEFFNSFQTALETVVEKAQKYGEAAVQQVANVLEEPPSSRVSLDIRIDAPVIYVPESTKSTNALMIDLGSMEFTNEFKIATAARSVLEVSKISLTNVRISRSILLENTVKNEKGVLNPINIDIDMVRNLSWTSASQIPQIDVNVKMHSISVTMTQGDYSMVQNVLQSNFGEVLVESTTPETESHPSKQHVKDDKTVAIRDKLSQAPRSDNVTVKFAFQMEYLDLELFKGDLSPTEWNLPVPAEKRLTKMTCDNLMVQGHMLLNTAMDVDVRLNNIKLLDTQPDSAKKINELIKTKSNETKDFVSVKFMLDQNGNIKLVVDIAGIYVCICMDYLMQLTDFFVKAQPPPPPVPKKTMIAVRGHEENPRKYRKKPQKPNIEPRLVDFEVDVHLERPEILLVENINSVDSNAIMVQMEVVFKYSLLKECDIINAEVRSFGATFCPFNEKKRKKYSMDIISPTSVAFYCNRPNNDGMQGSLTMEHLVINITPAVIQSVSKIISSLGTAANNPEDVAASEKSSLLNTDTLEQSDFWELKEFEDNEFSFIAKGLMEKNKITETESNVESGFDVAQMLLDVEQRRADQIYIRLPDIRVVLESEMGKKCVPMLILECSVDGDLKNPLTQVSVGITVALSVSYFNDHINIWEPLVEVYQEENKRQYCFEIEYITCDDSQLFAEEDFEDLASVEPSAVSILILSRDNLELTLSKTALDVLSNLGKAFEDAYSMNLEDHRSAVGAPYMIKNSCGLDLVVYLTEDFDLKAVTADSDNSVILKKDTEIQLFDAKLERTLITDEKKARIVQIGFVDKPGVKENLSIHKSEVRGLFIGSRDTKLLDVTNHMLVVQTTAYLGMKNLDLRSILQVFNNSEDDLDIYYKSRKQPESSTDFIFIANVLKGQHLNVPIPVLDDTDNNMYLSVPSFKTGVSPKGAIWKVPRGTQLPGNQVIECTTDTGCVYYYSVNVKEQEIPEGFSDTDETKVDTFKVDIYAPISLHNQLPIPVSYQSQIFTEKVEPGTKHFLRTAAIDKQSTLKINYEYQQKDWFGVLDLRPRTDELGVINFKARDGFTEMAMDLGVHTVVKDGQASITLYSPYWMINKTGHDLTYRAGEDYQVNHYANNPDAVLFSFLSKSIFSKKKTSPSQQNLQSLQNEGSQPEPQPVVESIETGTNNSKFAKSVKAYCKIDDSSWSDKFSLDTVGSNGKIICKKKPVSFEIGVKINLSSCGLTKIVTFMPYYMIINQSSVNLFCNELAEGAAWISLPPGEAVPFWPRSEVGKAMMMRCKVEDREILVTQPFPFFESHSILMKLEKKYVGVFVEVQITEEANLITLQLYQEGMALVQLVNHLGDNVEIHFKQSGCNQEQTLPPQHSIMYAWQDSRQKKELLWRVEGDNKKQHGNSLTSDGIEDFYVNEMKAYWVSFVLDMHRILLFTNDIHVAKNARLSTDLENIDMEVTISLHSIGLSLVDNERLQELAYISVTSSGIKWNQVRRKNRHKPLKVSQSEALELAYDEYINKMRVGEKDIEQHIVKVEDLEVDLSKKLMMKPEKCELIRVFEPGVYLQYRTSPHQMHVHLRVFRIQVDNQMDDCNFPVVFAPFPPPRSVTLDAGLKPLIEMSAVIGKTSETGSMRFKYFRVLIQEMQLMLDQGFVNAILDYVSGSVPDFDEEEMFKKDCKMIEDSLIETPTIKSILQGGKKCVFDNFHISPIKIHLSFSLSRVSRTGKTALHSEVLNLFLQSVGIAITDMQDVIFKLGYFEKQNSIMPMNQMVGAMTRHYVSQGLRQMYVLVLGLDVLGNPFGVIRGMAQGVEDLFYEPVRGAILGPEEFAEGVAYGVKSLFGHAVGGAAGAVSRIVGTMGKGIAALTLDADYQRKRREQLARRPENLGVGLAQGGKGLIVGIVQGVTGVVTKPFDGAKKDGVEGFFKGVGKGLVGVVTRPVSGVVDFASSSFEGIRRVADTNIEVYRIRPPRFISKDGVIRSYGLREAEGIAVWKKVIEKSEPLTNEVYVFHIYCKSKRNILLLTNMRILHLDRNDLLGTWSIHWQVTYDKLDGNPTINENKRAIVFTLKEKQRKMFAKDNITKEIEADVGALKVVITKVMEIVKQMKVSVRAAGK